MSAPVPPDASPTARPGRRSRAFTFGIVAYAGLLIAAFATGIALLKELAAFALISLLLLSGLRHGRVLVWAIWLMIAAILVWLARIEHGQLALDSLPILINAALCLVFARTLGAQREPLIARIIAILEGLERLAMPGVAHYARWLTWAWALVLGAQACLLLVVVACTVPDGVFASFAIEPPLAISQAWRWYLHLGSYALVLSFLVLEYAYRRWHLRHLPHMSLPLFIAQLAQRWPALVAGFAADAGRRER